MKNLFAEAILIFLSVLASFTVDGFRKEVKEKEELNEALDTLSKEHFGGQQFLIEYVLSKRQKRLKNVEKI